MNGFLSPVALGLGYGAAMKTVSVGLYALVAGSVAHFRIVPEN